MLVHVVDPSAFTPPYDHALCEGLAREGAEVELFTSRFAHGSAPVPVGYRRREVFYRGTARLPSPAARRALKLASHVPDMLRYRTLARGADVVHFQWLALQHLDGWLLPPRRTPYRARRPLVLTAHDVLPREPRIGQRAAQRRLYDRFDAVVVHSQHGRERLVGELGVPPERVHVIPHGVFTHLAERPAPLPSAALAASLPFDTERPVALFFGLMRPYKGIEQLLDAWRGIEGAELWVVGAPRMDVAPLIAGAPRGVRFVKRYVDDAELAALFRRADLVVLPYREIDQSGVLHTALAFARPMLLSDVGGFPEIAATGAARTFPAADVGALRERLAELLADPAARAEMAAAADRQRDGERSWAAVARSTISLYESLLEGEAPG